MYKPGDKVRFTLMLYKYEYELEKTILLVKKDCIYFTDNSKINFLLIMKISVYIVNLQEDIIMVGWILR